MGFILNLPWKVLQRETDVKVIFYHCCMNFFIPIFTDSYSLFAYEGWRTGECPDNDPASTMWSFALDDKLIPAKSKSTTPLSLSANVAAGVLDKQTMMMVMMEISLNSWLSVVRWH